MLSSSQEKWPSSGKSETEERRLNAVSAAAAARHNNEIRVDGNLKAGRGEGTGWARGFVESGYHHVTPAQSQDGAGHTGVAAAATAGHRRREGDRPTSYVRGAGAAGRLRHA